VADGFTYGELVIGVFAFLIWATLLFSMIWAFVMRIRVKL
jgi:large-conductance mechanosensitive channel